MTNKYKECIGCTAMGYDGKCVNGLDQDMLRTHLCPCMNCLVKMMCVKECKEFLKYVKRYSPKLMIIKQAQIRSHSV